MTSRSSSRVRVALKFAERNFLLLTAASASSSRIVLMELWRSLAIQDLCVGARAVGCVASRILHACAVYPIHVSRKLIMAAGESPYVAPTTVTDAYWVFATSPSATSEDLQQIYGKWLVFRSVSRIDETWKTVYDAILSGELSAPRAKCSTSKENPRAGPSRNASKVICVYTSREDMEVVGLQLVHLVKETIRYKPDEATHRGMYAHTHKGPVTTRTLDWNDGDPKFSDKRKL